MQPIFEITVFLLSSAIIFTAAFPSTSPHGAAAIPTRRQSTTYNEDLPWQVSDIVVFTANDTSEQKSSVSFQIVDMNMNLVLNTTCFAIFSAGQPPDTGESWISCADQHFGFQYTGGQIGIQRTWDDPK
jgi:hypothetical protein